MRANLIISGLFLMSSVAACASRTPGAEPHAMSAAEHERMATEAEREARGHEQQFQPAARPTARCGGGREGACWTSMQNPTQAHLDEAAKYRQMATEHRAASQELRDAEARACAGIPAEDRDESPFMHREDIASVEPLNVTTTGARQQYTRMEGAVVTFRAVPGLTTQWLQRVIDCHLARNAALGHNVPEMPNCPLVPKDVTADVVPAHGGFAVQIRSSNPETAREVLRRAEALVAH